MRELRERHLLQQQPGDQPMKLIVFLCYLAIDGVAGTTGPCQWMPWTAHDTAPTVGEIVVYATEAECESVGGRLKSAHGGYYFYYPVPYSITKFRCEPS